jgi:DnaJ-class molecular chaperone
MRDPYTVLGIPRTASDADVKSAYRRLAKRLHPDLNPGNRAREQQFRELSAANELLSDPDKRRRYDRGEIDADGKERGFTRATRGAGGAGVNIDDLIQEFFGRGRRPGGANGRRGAGSTRQTLRIGFLEAALGGTRQVALADGRSVEVKIPPGTASGETLRLRDAAAGEALLAIEVEPHPAFTRTERDIHLEAPVGLADAVLGASITVPTIHGDVAVKVPKGSNSGTVLRLKGKGIVSGGLSGDQYVKLRIVLPDPPDPELQAALERWAERRAAKVRRPAF